MTDTNPVDNARDAIAKQIDKIVDGARMRAAAAAGQVADGKKPVNTLADAGVAISKVSHKATGKIIKQQARIVSNSIDAVAGRLQAAAGAESLKDLVTTQVRLVPENTARLINDTRDAFGIVVDAGAEVRGIVVKTFGTLRGKAPAKAAKPAKKAAAKKPAPKKPTQKKATTKKAAAKKAPARKTVARKSTATKATATKAPAKPVAPAAEGTANAA